jgi:lysophospholipase L1-like esterase
VAEWKECHLCSTKGFDYINEEGSVVYEKTLSAETGASVQEAGLTSGTMVDDFGNVIVRRIMDEISGDHDRNVVVDSFSPEGVKTRLFNSSSLATEGVKDSFTTYSALAYGAMSKGHIYLPICHEEGKITEGCSTSMNPEVVSISDTTIGEYDYPRSAIFTAGAERSSYVALGDSYSSGEGVPSFIPPSDEDGCHRSYDAYPAYLAATVPALRLDAFVACSGAKTTDVEEEFKEEVSQLYSLGSDTKVVTITIGGNDIGFGGFAEECVISTCDSSSPAYEYSMEQIATYLPEKLENTYRLIHEYAESAEVFVVGYPQVVSETEPECGVIFAKSEEQASREVVTALDEVIQKEAEAAEGKFVYVNPDAEGSPFIGHELCVEEAESYFNGFYFPETEYSFHPNERGQQAYAELIAEVL